jgi:hypothetical protein
MPSDRKIGSSATQHRPSGYHPLPSSAGAPDGAHLTGNRGARATPMAAVVAPAVDESFVSWVDRTAAAFGLTAGETLRGLGLLAGRSQRIPLYGVSMARADRERVGAVTGLGGARIGAMLLERFDGSALDLSGLSRGAAPGSVAVQEGALFWGSRCCPCCVAESGGAWNLWWKLRLAVACCRHATMLVDSCPGCAARPRQGRSGTGWPATYSAVPQPAICGHRLGGATCGFDLSAITPAQADGRVLNAQARVWERVAAGDRRWIVAVREAVALVRRFARPEDLGALPAAAVTAFAAEVDERDSGGRYGRPAGWFNTLPASPGVMAAVLPAAVGVIDGGGGESIGWLVSAARQTSRGWRCLPERLGWSSVVAQRWRAGVRPFLGFAEMGRNCAARVGIDARHVPQCAPEGLWQLVAPLVPGTAEPTGRTFVALATVVAIEGCSWPAAGTRLGLTAGEAAQLANVVVKRIAERERFWAAIAEVVAVLAADPVDYRMRRVLLAELTEVDPLSWVSMCHRNGISPGKAVRRRYAAGWAWAAVTGGLVRRSPAWAAAIEDGARPASLQEGDTRFARWLSASVGVELVSRYEPG